MMTAVTRTVHDSGWPTVFECRSGLVGWYARWGFGPQGAVLRPEPDPARAVAPVTRVAGRPGVRSDA